MCDTRNINKEEDDEAACFEVIPVVLMIGELGEGVVQDGVGYNPGDWIDYEITSTALDCQTHCRSHPECRIFTFYTDTHKCYRKAGEKDRTSSRSEAVSGPRTCPGNFS